MNDETGRLLVEALGNLNRNIALQSEMLEDSAMDSNTNLLGKDIQFRLIGDVDLLQNFRSGFEEIICNHKIVPTLKEELLKNWIELEVSVLRRDVVSFAYHVTYCLEALCNIVLIASNAQLLTDYSNSLSNKSVFGLSLNWVDEGRFGFFTNNNGNTEYKSLLQRISLLEKLFNPKRGKGFGLITGVKRRNLLNLTVYDLDLKHSHFKRVTTKLKKGLEDLKEGDSIVFFNSGHRFNKPDSDIYDDYVEINDVKRTTSEHLTHYHHRFIQYSDGEAVSLPWSLKALRNYAVHGSFKGSKDERKWIDYVQSDQFEVTPYISTVKEYLIGFLENEDLFGFIDANSI